MEAETVLIILKTLQCISNIVLVVVAIRIIQAVLR